MTVELSAEARRNADNDLIRAGVFAEATGTIPKELARRVNKQIAQALEMAHTDGRVQIRSGSTRTEPIYGKSPMIESWRIRSDLLLESGDAEALSELLSKLQVSMRIVNLTSTPTVETRRKTENEAIIDAIAAFRLRAETVAGALGKSYRIRRLTINGRTLLPPEPVMMRSAPEPEALSSRYPSKLVLLKSASRFWGRSNCSNRQGSIVTEYRRPRRCGCRPGGLTYR